MKDFKARTYQVIFEHDTKAGKAFDIALIVLVFLSVLTIIMETVQQYWILYKDLFHQVEWFFTILFTVELALRVFCAPDRRKYLFSFYGVIDVVAVLPTYLSILVPGAQAFIIVRAMRLLRIFRILKLNRYTSAGKQLSQALASSKQKIIVFVFFVITFVTIVGTAMYYIEGNTAGFTSIPTSIYWAIVTMTTVGYGDITPITNLGKFLAAILMITGYGVIAVPTGIISTEMAKLDRKAPEGCDICLGQSLPEGSFCFNCGRKLSL